jgi:hypothetical protein
MPVEFEQVIDWTPFLVVMGLALFGWLILTYRLSCWAIGLCLKPRDDEATQIIALVDADGIGHVDGQYHLVPQQLLDMERLTAFQRWVLGEFRAKRGVPVYNAANLVMVRLQILSIIKDANKNIRGYDLECLTTRLTALAFIPSKDDVFYSQLFVEPVCHCWSRCWCTCDRNVVLDRINALERPRD